MKIIVKKILSEQIGNLSLETNSQQIELQVKGQSCIKMISEMFCDTSRVKCHILLGDAGVGKSHCIKRHVLKRATQSHHDTIPLYIDYEFQMKTLTKAMILQLAKYGLHDEEINTFRKNAKIELYIDHFSCNAKDSFNIENELDGWSIDRVFVCARSVEFFNQDIANYFIYESIPASVWHCQPLTDKIVDTQISTDFRPMIRSPLMRKLYIEKKESLQAKPIHIAKYALIEAWIAYQAARLPSITIEYARRVTLLYLIAITRRFKELNDHAITMQCDVFMSLSEDDEVIKQWQRFMQDESETKVAKFCTPFNSETPHRIKLFDNEMNNFISQLKFPVPDKSLPTFITGLEGAELLYRSLKLRLDVKNVTALRQYIASIDDNTYSTDDFIRVILASRYGAEYEVAAANAITLLNLMGMSFARMNLSHIRIPNADLELGMFDTSDLSYADLSKVNFRQAWLHRANLRYSVIDDVEFSQRPYQRLVIDIKLFFAYKIDSTAGLIYNVGARRLHVFSSETQLEIFSVPIDIVQSKFNSNLQNSISISNDECVLAVLSKSGVVELWNLVEYKRIKIFQIGLDLSCFRRIQISMDGKQLAVLLSHSNVLSIHLYDSESGQAKMQLDITSRVGSAFLNSQFTLVVLDNINEIELRDIFSKQQIAVCHKNEDSTARRNSSEISSIINITGARSGFEGNKILISNNSKIIVKVEHKKICVWNLLSSEPYCEFLTPNGIECNVIAISHNSKYIAAGFKDRIVVWDIQRQDTVYEFSVKDIKELRYIQFLKDDTELLSVSSDSQGLILNYHYLNRTSLSQTRPLQYIKVTSALFSPDNKLLATTANGNLKLWSTKNWKLCFQDNVEAIIQDICFSPNSDRVYVLGLASSTITAYDIKNINRISKLVTVISGDFHHPIMQQNKIMFVHRDSVDTAVTPSESSILCDIGSISPDCEQPQQKAAGYKVITKLVHQKVGNCNYHLGYSVCSITADNRSVWVGNDDDSVHNLNLENMSVVCNNPLRTGFFPIYDVQSRFKITVKFSDMNLFRLNKRNAGLVCSSMDGTHIAGTSCLPNQNSDFVVVQQNHSVTWLLPIPFTVWAWHYKKQMTISYNNQYLGVSSGEFCYLWEIKQKPINHIEFIPEKNDNISCCAFSNNSQYFSYGTSYGEIVVWDINANRTLDVITGLNGQVNQISWHERGAQSYFIAVTDENIASYWQLVLTEKHPSLKMLWINGQISLNANDTRLSDKQNPSSAHLLSQFGAITSTPQAKTARFRYRSLSDEEVIEKWQNRHKLDRFSIENKALT